MFQDGQAIFSLRVGTKTVPTLPVCGVIFGSRSGGYEFDSIDRINRIYKIGSSLRIGTKNLSNLPASRSRLAGEHGPNARGADSPASGLLRVEEWLSGGI